MVSESAKSKIILIGEHAVIYGAKAIGIPCNAYSKVTIRSQKDKGILFCGVENSTLNDKAVLLDIAQHVLAKLGVRDVGLKIEVSCDVPPGLGFGLSASLSIAIVKALYRFFSKEISRDELLQFVGELENLNHGNASGIDHSVIIQNQPILFQKSTDSVEIKSIPGLLNKEIFQNCYLVNTGKPMESTKEMVEFVAQQFEKSPTNLQSIFDEVSVLTPKVLAACENADYKELVNLINRAGILLEDLGVVSAKVKDFSRELRASGSAVKISGAGGKSDAGSGIALVFTKDKPLLKAMCEKYSFEVLDFEVV